MVYKIRPYSGKIRTYSLRLFWICSLLLIMLAFGLEAFSGWSLIRERIIGTTFLVLVLMIAGSGLVGSACILQDWWAWLQNRGF
jgi:hypothetical protein